MMDELPQFLTGATAGWLALMTLCALVYLVLTLLIGARLALGRLAAERLADEARLSEPLDPGTRPWISVGLLRQVALLGVPFSGLMTEPRPFTTSMVASVAVLLLGRLAQDILAPGAPEPILGGGGFLLRWLDRLFGPLVSPLSRRGPRFALQASLENGIDDDVREEQIEEYIRDAEEGGLLEREQGRLVREIVDLGDLIVREVMTPRTEIASIEVEVDAREAAEAMIRSFHSRLPVYEGTLDRIVGVLSVRDLLPYVFAGGSGAPVREIMRPIPLVPATKRALELLRELQDERQQMAIVVDEYGGTAGLVTIEDILEEIVGEIHDEHEIADEGIRPDPEEEGSYLADGLVTVEDLEDLVGLDIPAGGVETVGGLVFAHLGRIPRIGERVQVLPELELEVVRMRGRRIALVRARKLPATAATAPEPDSRAANGNGR
jgi:CBS domain containing-hemolysin-like protein